MEIATSLPRLVIKGLGMISSALVINQSLKQEIAKNHKG